MKTIYKYTLDAVGKQELMLHGKVLSVGVQDGQIVVWAVHDDDIPAHRVQISVRGTGHLLGDVDESDFVGTVFMGPFVWHIFAAVSR